MEADSDSIQFTGRILYLTEDPELLRRQLGGEDLPFDEDRALRNNISTDEITPGWVCFYYASTPRPHSMVRPTCAVFDTDSIHNCRF